MVTALILYVNTHHFTTSRSAEKLQKMKQLEIVAIIFNKPMISSTGTSQLFYIFA